MNLELLQILLNIILVITSLYIIFIAAFTYGLYNLKERFDKYDKSSPIRISILIAARNEEDNIYNLLQSIYNQSFSKELFEVLIIDDHSEDNTQLIIDKFIHDHKDLNLKVFKSEKTGKKAETAAERAQT